MEINELTTKKVTPLGDFNCQSFPIDNNKCYDITEEELTKLGNHELKWHLEETTTTEEIDDFDSPILDNENEIIGYEKKVITTTKYIVSLVPNDNTQELLEKHQNELRQVRANLFKAFDIYKSNVEYGVLTETEQKHNEIVEWYSKCLELDENAIENYPSELEKYL